MRVLDACCCSRRMYHGLEKKLGDNFVGIDIRRGDYSIPKREGISRVGSLDCVIKPTVLASMKYLPFKDGSFDIIICDPPHLDIGKNSYTYIMYGSWDETTRVSVMYNANKEFKRVLRDGGTLILKIMPDKTDSYFSLLSNFIFYLPIFTIRDRGCFSSKEQKSAAVWYVGIKNE